jgi:outer membrane protein assembly factor BamA
MNRFINCSSCSRVRSCLGFGMFLLIYFAATSVQAQILSVPDEDDRQGGVHYSLVPVLGYSSDTGLIGGVVLQRFNYGDGRSPFLSNLKADFTVSTKADLISELNYERTRLFGRDIRSEYSVIAERYKRANYFGIGNDTEFSSQLYDQDYYFFEKRVIEVAARYRKTVAEYGFAGNFDGFIQFGFSYLDASDQAEESLFATEQPVGDNRQLLNSFGFGVIAEDRDSEFNPTEGYRYEAGIEFSGPYTGSEFNYAKVHLQLRNYVEILPKIVLAQKIEGTHLMGDAPFWKRSSLADKYGLRGYYKDRFLGDSSILHILEARSWLFSLFEDEIRLGGQLFWDSGRVFSNNDSNRFFDNWKSTFGFGGAISIYNPDFIMRGDIGFSEESTQIYIGIGYIF